MAVKGIIRPMSEETIGSTQPTKATQPNKAQTPNPTLKFALERQILAYLDNADVIERYRNSDIVSAEAVWPFFRYERQWLLHAGVVSESESDKEILSSFGPAHTNNDQLAGLAISYNIVRSLEGKIWYDTVLNEGTTFYVELPRMVEKR